MKRGCWQPSTLPAEYCQDCDPPSLDSLTIHWVCRLVRCVGCSFGTASMGSIWPIWSRCTTALQLLLYTVQCKRIVLVLKVQHQRRTAYDAASVCRDQTPRGLLFRITKVVGNFSYCIFCHVNFVNSHYEHVITQQLIRLHSLLIHCHCYDNQTVLRARRLGMSYSRTCC